MTAVDVWPYRHVDGRTEFLLLHRLPGPRDLPPFWQGVSGRIEPDESAVQAALRELREETALVPVALYSIDSIFSIYEPRDDRVSTVVPFAAELSAESEPLLSDEHDEFRWELPSGALQLLPYHPQRDCLRRFAADVLERPELGYLHRVPMDR